MRGSFSGDAREKELMSTKQSGWRFVVLGTLSFFTLLLVAQVFVDAAANVAEAQRGKKKEEGPYDDVERRLQIAVKSKTIDQIRHWANVLIATNDPKAVDVLVRLGLQADDPKIEDEISFRLHQVPNGKIFDHLCHLCNKHADSRVRGQLTVAFARRKEPAAYKAILQSLYDKKESVQIAAVKALRTKTSLSCVDHLIRALKYQEDTDRTFSETAAEIRKLLQKFLNPNKKLFSRDEWSNYWRNNGDRIKREGPKTGEDSEATRGGTGVIEKLRIPEFFGREVLADRIVFVIDCSISMGKKDPVPPAGLVGKDPDDRDSGGSPGRRKGRTGVVEKAGGKSKSGEKGTAGKLDPSQWPVVQRVRRVQSELTALIRVLPESAKFTVISYSDVINRWSGGLVFATEKNKKDAVRFVQRFNPGGQTHTDEALQAAFAIPGVRTIYLLSDGAPVRNQQTINAQEIVEWSEIENRHRRVKVNTVGFSATRDEVGNFLQILAYRNYGKYIEIP